MWNPIEVLKRKIKGETAAEGAPPQNASAPSAGELAALEKAAKAAASGDASSLAALEKQGMMSKFFRHWKNPALLKQVKAAVARMRAEGVNVRDKDAVQAWLKAHQKEIESGELADAPQAAKPQTFVKTAPEIGRNDPCPCGSGKKYKKCCALNKP